MSETKTNVSLSHFSKLRPKHVKVRQKASLWQSLCMKCENFRLKLVALNLVKTDEVSDRTKTDEVFDRTLCQKEGKYHLKTCIWRECDQYGTDKLEKVKL